MTEPKWQMRTGVCGSCDAVELSHDRFGVLEHVPRDAAEYIVQTEERISDLEALIDDAKELAYELQSQDYVFPAVRREATKWLARALALPSTTQETQ